MSVTRDVHQGVGGRFLAIGQDSGRKYVNVGDFLVVIRGCIWSREAEVDGEGLSISKRG